MADHVCKTGDQRQSVLLKTLSAGNVTTRGLHCTLFIQGILLLFAGAAKAYELAIVPITTYILPVTLGLVCIELSLGIWLAFGSRSTWTWRLAVATFSLFAAVAAWNIFLGNESCGCFGVFRVPPWTTLLVDVTILAHLALFRHGVCHDADRQVVCRLRMLFPFAMGTVVLVCTVTIIAQTNFKTLHNGVITSGDLVVLDPDSWVGTRFGLLRHIELDKDLSIGEWSVVLFRHDCHVCHDVMREIAEDLEIGKTNMRIALIAIDGNAANGVSFDLEALGCSVGYLSPDKEWFATTPLRVALKDGICQSAEIIRHWK